MDPASVFARYYGYQFRIMRGSAQQNVQTVASRNERIRHVLHASLLLLHLL